MNDYELLAAALSRGRGGDFDLAALRTAIAARDYIRTDGSRKLVSRELLQYELDIVLAARESRHEALNAAYCPDSHLSAEQQRAARQILNSRQFITVFRGGAGTGKSRTLKEIEVALAAAGRPVVVLAPQRQQVCDLQTDGLPAETLAHALTAAGIGRLGEGVPLKVYQPVDRSEAQKRDPRFYQPGQAVHFLRTYGRFNKGETCELLAVTDRGIILAKKGRRSVIGYRHADRSVVANPMQVEIAPGDRLQIKANGRSVEGERLHNGELVTVSRIDPNGALVVADERGRTKTLAIDQRLLVPGYAVTSYASQGKTADVVLFADAGNAAATSARQWYVTISRGRKRVMVFTPDKDGLRSAIVDPRERELAIDDERFSLAIRLAQRRRENLRQTQTTHAAIRL